MNKSEIKKALYKQKPIARRLGLKKEGLPEELKDVAVYLATIVIGSGKGVLVEFRIPFDEMNSGNFTAEMPAQLLIRWLHTTEK